MSSDSEGSVTLFFSKLRSGDHEAADELWKRFFPRLRGLARRTLGDCRIGMTDEEDAVQSAFVSFWQRAQRGDFSGDLHRDNLWNLLAEITVRRVKKHLVRERTKKRGAGKVVRESSLSDPTGESPATLDALFANVDGRDFDLCGEELLLQLDEPLRKLALMRLMGYANREIALALDCTERTVERKLQLIRLSWKSQYGDRGC
jgi:RNA polymerase sigma factor (sigma-70 family)